MMSQCNKRSGEMWTVVPVVVLVRVVRVTAANPVCG